jgi:acetyltransferase-like isoleucine patch superfamily enzyme
MPGRSGVRGQMVRDRAKRSEDISGLSSRIWCCLGSLIPGPSVVKDWTVRDRTEWSRAVPGRFGHIWRDLDGLRVDSCRVGRSGVIRRPVHTISGRSDVRYRMVRDISGRPDIRYRTVRDISRWSGVMY